MAAAGDEAKGTPSSDSAVDAGNSAGPARRHLTLREASRRLRITSRDTRQLLATGQLAGFWGRDSNGAATAYVYEDAVQALADRMERMTPDE